MNLKLKSLASELVRDGVHWWSDQATLACCIGSAAWDKVEFTGRVHGGLNVFCGGLDFDLFKNPLRPRGSFQ